MIHDTQKSRAAEFPKCSPHAHWKSRNFLCVLWLALDSADLAILQGPKMVRGLNSTGVYNFAVVHPCLGKFCTAPFRSSPGRNHADEYWRSLASSE